VVAAVAMTVLMAPITMKGIVHSPIPYYIKLTKFVKYFEKGI
jgi:hypothetical protein